MDELHKFGLTYRESDAPDRMKIDFTLEDGEDNVASVWGDKPSDVDFECSHPDTCVEYEDDETVGECLLCGATCDWYWATSSDDGYPARERVPYRWKTPRRPKGIIKEILKERSKR